MNFELIKLLTITSLGTFATILNVKQPGTTSTFSIHLSIANSVVALFIGLATFVFMIYQIIKIRKDIKTKYTKKNETK